jgi:toxin ParE1/3/4
MSIREQILTLEQFPERYSLVELVSYAAKGIRKMPIENYTVFYLIHRKTCTVHVIRVLYNRRQWINLI